MPGDPAPAAAARPRSSAIAVALITAAATLSFVAMASLRSGGRLGERAA